MRQLFEKLESVEAEKTSFVISALGAEHLGKKAVVSGGEVLSCDSDRKDVGI